eukprot:m.296055 g.296055  ORF g.296055 m.296055 type:complete len:1020 (+) comp13312_c0_seq1:82-3141(+)
MSSTRDDSDRENPRDKWRKAIETIAAPNSMVLTLEDLAADGGAAPAEPSTPPAKTSGSAASPKKPVKIAQGIFARVASMDQVPAVAAPAPGCVRVLIIAMAKKIYAKPMQNILDRLCRHTELRVSILEEEFFFAHPIEEWPACDALIAFYSGNYPLAKVEAYARLHKPFVMNNLAIQHQLLDRVQVYTILKQCGVPVPNHVIIREGDDFEEKEDSITVDGVTISKPFVEKPLDAEDHNIRVYFASNDGGGAQRLFRKKDDRSSEFLPDAVNVRRDRSYLYERFVPTGGTDIKVYMVGEEYAHAEARKSPVVDGKVLRDNDGKELRCPIMLNKEEKEIARKVVKAFKQNICGFDILRTQGGSFVCDVNGWSFVKRSNKYYDDAAELMHMMIIGARAPELLPHTSMPEMPIAGVEKKARPQLKRSFEPELRCVIAVVRHGDRTPKQKMKLNIEDPRLLGLFKVFSDTPKKLKLKTRKQLETVIETIRQVLADGEDHGKDESIDKLTLVTHVLTRSPIHGINRKVQFNPIEIDDAGNVTKAMLILKWGGELTELGAQMAEKFGAEFREMLYPSNGPLGLLRLHNTMRHDLKIYSSDEGRVQMTAAAFAKGLLGLEGDLPPILVSLVRKDEEANHLLDDTTAARKLLDKVKAKVHGGLREDRLSSELIPTLAPTMSPSVVLALSNLENSPKAMQQLYTHMQALCKRLQVLVDSVDLSKDRELFPMIERWRTLTMAFYVKKTGTFDVSKIPDIYDCVKYDLLHRSGDFPEHRELFHIAQNFAGVIVPQEYGVTYEEKVEIGKLIARPLMTKILHDLRTAAGKGSKYEHFQNEVSHQFNSTSNELGVQSPGRHVRSRLYFTSESHIHALLNMLYHSGFDDHTMNIGRRRTVSDSELHTHSQLSGSSRPSKRELSPPPPSTRHHSHAENQMTWENAQREFGNARELDFLSNIIIRLFEQPHVSLDSPERFIVEWSFSPGVHNVHHGGHIASELRKPIRVHTGLSLSETEFFFADLIETELPFAESI